MSDTSSQPDDQPPLPPSLRFLKGLVIVLTLTMIGGVITVVGLLVTRMPQAYATTPKIPADLMLPAGTVAQAVTFGQGWTAVVTGGNRILIFNTSGVLVQDIAITATAPQMN